MEAHFLLLFYTFEKEIDSQYVQQMSLLLFTAISEVFDK